MKQETFFEKFDQFADAPNAAAKMRELVLNLAVQGRLVSNSTENTLRAEQIASEKQRRLRELNIRSHPETSQPTKDDFPFSLPKAWHAVALGDLAYSCPTSYGEDPIPSLPKAGVVKVGNIDNQGGFKGHFAERGFPPDEIESLLARRGDLMVVKSSGSAENVHSGKTALCTAVHDGKIVGTNFVLRLRLLGTPALPEYVWRVLTSRYSRAWIEGTVQTMTYPNLKWSDFARLPIPLPPLAEQNRIVAKVDELMALCDRLEAQQQEQETRHASLARASLARFADAPTSANLHFLFHPSYAVPPAELRKSILTLAVQGKLVPQDPNDEPAEKMLECESLFEIPASWQWNPLGTLGLCRTGRTPPTSDPTNYGEGIPFIGPGQITPNGKFTPPEKTITSKALESSTEANVSDILMVCIGGSIGKAAICRETLGFNQQINSVRLKRDLPEFVYLAVTAEYFQEQVLANASGSATPIINKGKWERISVPIPPLAEQRRIVAKVEQLMALVDALESQLAASRATAANLLSALVAELTAA